MNYRSNPESIFLIKYWFTIFLTGFCIFIFYESPYGIIIFFPLIIWDILNFIAVELRINGQNIQYRQYWFAWKTIDLDNIIYSGSFWVYGRIKLKYRIGLSKNLLYIESSQMPFQKWEMRNYLRKLIQNQQEPK